MTPSLEITVALVGNVGNSVAVRGGLEVLLDSTANALARIGVKVVRRLERHAAAPDLYHFFGCFYGLEDAFAAARHAPRVLSPVLLLADDALERWRAPVDRARSFLPFSILSARRRMLRESVAVMVNSAEEADNARAFGARSAEVLHCGVDLDLFTPSAGSVESLPREWHERAHTFLAQTPRVISVGRFERRKNQVEVARACRSLGVPVLFIGRRSPVEHGYVDEVRAATAHPELVHEDAPLSFLRWALAQSEVHVLATRHETIGLVSLEAAASGARPVVIAQPTSREYFGAYGELAAAPTVEALSAAIERALGRGRISSEERALLEPVSWDAFARSTARVYARVLGRTITV